MAKGNLNTTSWRKAIKVVNAYKGGRPTPELEAAHAAVNGSVVGPLARTCCLMCQRLTGRIECHACSITYKGNKKSWPSALDAGRLCPTCARGLRAYLGYGTFYPARIRRAMFKVQAKLVSRATAKHNTVEGQREYVAQTLKARARYRAMQRQSLRQGK